MARVSPYLRTDRQSDFALLAFPEKLWWIVNNPKREEIHWNLQGTAIVIPSIQRFVSEILNNPSSALFKTKHFASFVRQLNLYGFRKVTEYAKRTSTSPLSFFSKCEFKHPYFRKGRQDLLVHVKRQLYSTKKTEQRRQNVRTPQAKEKQFDQLPGSTSLSATWNPTLYSPMQFVPWQTSLPMPFTLYAPFCNPYQLAQTQQGPIGGFPNFQRLGLAGQFTQSLTSPSMMSTQSSGSCEGIAKSVSTSASVQHQTRDTGIVSSQETLPVEAAKSAYESAESSVECSQSFTVHPLLKESSAKPFASNSQTFTVDSLLRKSTVKPSVSGSQFDAEVRYAQGLCNSKGLPFSCV